MKAVKQSLQMEPALPERFPAWRSITSTGQVASHAGNLSPEGFYRHARRREPRVSRQDREQFWVNDLMGWARRCLAKKITHLQQPHSHSRQQTQPVDQTVCTLHLSFFDTAFRFEVLMIVLYSPAGAIPLDAFPSLLTGRK